MKSSNKILSLLLALVIFVTAFTGCDLLSNSGSFSGETTTEGLSETSTNFPAEETSEEYISTEHTTDSKAEETVSTQETETTNSETETTNSETETTSADSEITASIVILQGNECTLEIGDNIRLTLYKSSSITDTVGWFAEGKTVYVDENGLVTALSVGDVVVTAFVGNISDSIVIHVVEKTLETTEPVTTEATEETTEAVETERGELEKRPLEEIIEAVNSPSGYTPAGSYEEALDRSKNGELSGYPFVPDQAPIISEYQPTKDGKLIKNNDSYYLDYNTYVVIDAYGREVFRIYRGGAYITLEEVAAYVYAFGTYPANHTATKTTSVSGNVWGKYLRSNHTKFSGNTSKYPYEPELPRISGCGGDLQYWEMDIGTTGTDCDPSYRPTIYNNGTKITRGAARIVYTWNDLNNNGINDGNDVVFVFYTYNHYNDFQEYLNYYGGWGEMFGNITGGGAISSKTDYNPTEYVPVYTGSLTDGITKTEYMMFAWVDRRAFEILLNA